MSLTISAGGSTTVDTPARILAKLLTVDGAGSGLDADLVRGLGPDSSPFLSGGLIGVIGFGQTIPKSQFQGCSYPAAFLGV